MRPPLALVEVGNTDGLPDPVVTKEDGMAIVSIPWAEAPFTPEFLAEAIRVLEKYAGEHPRIDLALERLKQLQRAPEDRAQEHQERIQDIWRTPAEETNEYPGLYVHDGRSAGSITAGRSRSALWWFIYGVVVEGWTSVADDYGLDVTKEELGSFLYHLLEARGEFARLLLTIAEADRQDGEHDEDGDPWWAVEERKRPVVEQLRRCLEVLDPEGLPRDTGGGTPGG